MTVNQLSLLLRNTLREPWDSSSAGGRAAHFTLLKISATIDPFSSIPETARAAADFSPAFAGAHQLEVEIASVRCELSSRSFVRRHNAPASF
jgi:hypothetical protein